MTYCVSVSNRNSGGKNRLIVLNEKLITRNHRFLEHKYLLPGESHEFCVDDGQELIIREIKEEGNGG